MRTSSRPLKFVAVLVALFLAGMGLVVGYQWFEGSIFSEQLFVTAASNAAPAEAEAPASIVAPAKPAPSAAIASPVATPGLDSSQSLNLPVPGEGLPDANVVVLSPAQPAAPVKEPGGNELTLPEAQPQGSPGSTETIPVIGNAGQTIWVPRAIEGCWEGEGDSRLRYLGGCPNLLSGDTMPVKLRWCFRRLGNGPLTLTMARGKYRNHVSQHWEVTGAHGRTINLRETISYRTMAFMQVVDVGEWTCRITSSDQLECSNHELAQCGPGKWLRGPWFSGNGWVSARRKSGEIFGSRASSEP